MNLLYNNKVSDKKYANWVFTWNADDLENLPDTDHLARFLAGKTSAYVFQPEIGEEKQRLHLQGCFKFPIRRRKSTVLNEFKGEFGDELLLRCRLDGMEGTWEQSFEYCSKVEGRIGDKIYMSSNLHKYTGGDTLFLENKDNWYPWQFKVYEALFDVYKNTIKASDDRAIYWITDFVGNSGKSKFVKHVCFKHNDTCKLPFGSASQIRSAAIAAGPRKIYFIDIPRTLGNDDSIESIVSAIEDIKNGFVVSAMYGKFMQLIFEPPHVVVFANTHCPRGLMSSDRWRTYIINPMSHTLEVVK